MRRRQFVKAGAALAAASSVGETAPADVPNFPAGDLMRTCSTTLVTVVVLGLAAGVQAQPAAVAAAGPPAKAFRVLDRESPEGPRITPYLEHQLDLAWAQDQERRAAWAGAGDEAAVRRLQAETRARVLALIGGLPATRTPLNARVTGTVPMEGYRIEKLVFESQPGLHVTALLYVPDAPAGPKPAVLLPCGHSEVGKAFANYQEIGGRLALRGYVVLSWDPVGQGERSQFWDAARARSRYNLACGEHAVLGNLATLGGTSLVRYELWDGIRAADYLLTRPEVDPGRLSITGTSGGGLQSTWAGALDERIGVVAPSCFVTSLPMRMANRIFEDPDSDPEQDPPGLVSEGVDHAGLLLLAWPRPIHVSAAARDFVPIEGARRTVRELRALYGRLGHAERVGFAQGYHEHRYSAENQERAFAFLDRWNGLPARSGLASVRILPPESLQATPSGQVRVDLGGRSLVDVIREDWRARESGSRPTLTDLYRASPAAASRADHVSWEKTGETRIGDVSVDRYLLRHPGGLSLPLLHVHRPGAPAQRVLLEVSLSGKIGPAEWPSVLERLAGGDAVVSFDLRGTGEGRMRYRAASIDDPAIAPADEQAAYADPLSGVLANYVYNSLLTGRPYLLEAIDDVAAAARFSREALGARRVAIAGRGEAGLLAVSAARVLALELASAPGTPVFSWRDTVERGRETWPIQYLLPGGALLEQGR